MKKNPIQPLLALIAISAAAPAFADVANVTSVIQMNNNAGKNMTAKSSASNHTEQNLPDGRHISEDKRMDEEVKPDGTALRHEEIRTTETDANHNITETVATVESATDPKTGKKKIHRVKTVNGKTVQDETVEEPAAAP